MELAADEGFRQVERRGHSTAVPDAAHSVHVELTGLRAGREYFYRFRADGHLSPAGRTRTRFTPGELRVDFQVVPFVSRPDAAVETRASFVVPDREPALHPA